MWFDDMLDIQMLQSRLTIYADARQYSRIYEELFSKDSDISVSFHQEPLGLPDGKAIGSDEVKTYYHHQDHLVRKNLDFLGANLSCCQRIRLSEDKSMAYGTWYTYREDVVGPAFGRDNPPYPYQLSIGRYDNIFVKTSTGWKIRNINWVPVIKLDTYETTIDSEGNIRANTQDWPAPWVQYAFQGKKQDSRLPESESRKKQIYQDEAADIAYCEAVLNIRNRIGEFCDSWNSGEISAIPERFFAQNGTFFRQGLPDAVNGMENIQKYFTHVQSRAKRFKGVAGFVLNTSGVIEPDSSGKRAKAAWTLLALDPIGIDNGQNLLHFENHTGRWYVEWVLQNDTWKIDQMKWVNYARMSDLKGRLI